MIYKYPCISPINCYPLDVTLKRGKYLIECFGASGGDSERNIGGYGAFVSGIISLRKDTKLFLFIGSKGHLQIGQPTFNGGGRSHIGSNAESKGASGGGSTDVRLINSSDLKGLLSRIMVAGAGGGSEGYYHGIKGGNGMFFEGESGFKDNYPTSSQITLPTGGSSTKGGDAGLCVKDGTNTCNSNLHGHPGGFGYGGNSSDKNYGAGGGSGYFGGGGAGYAGSMVASGAGGSSYVSGQKGCHSFVEGEDGNIVETGSEIHPSGLFFTNIKYKNGNETFHSENGEIDITPLQTCILTSKICYRNKVNYILMCIIILKY